MRGEKRDYQIGMAQKRGFEEKREGHSMETVHCLG